MVYFCSSGALRLNMSSSDGDMCRVLQRRDSANSYLVFAVAAVGGPRQIRGADLSTAAHGLSELLGREPNLTCYFGLNYEIIPGYPVENAENATAVWINGKLHWIEAGLGRCDLIEVLVGPDGKGVSGNAQDISDRESLMSEKPGLIRIQKVPTRTTIGKRLQEVASFAESHKNEAISVIRDGRRR